MRVGRPNLSVKSSFLPSSSTKSAAARISANAPSAGSAIPRGLSMPITGMPRRSSSASRVRGRHGSGLVGPSERAVASRSKFLEQEPGVCECQRLGCRAERASGSRLPRRNRCLDTSVGKLICTGPGLPEARFATPSRDRRKRVDVLCRSTRPWSMAWRSRLVHLLERPQPELRTRGVSGEQQHRRLRHGGRVERRHCVGMSGTASNERHPDFAGETGPRVRHVHGRRFVSRMEQLETCIERRIEDRHDVIARKREQASNARVSQCANHKRLRPVSNAATFASPYMGYLAGACIGRMTMCMPSS